VNSWLATNRERTRGSVIKERWRRRVHGTYGGARNARGGESGASEPPPQTHVSQRRRHGAPAFTPRHAAPITFQIICHHVDIDTSIDYPVACLDASVAVTKLIITFPVSYIYYCRCLNIRVRFTQVSPYYYAAIQYVLPLR